MTDLASDQLMSGMLDSQTQGLPSDLPPNTPAPANMDVDDTQEPTPRRPTRRPGFEPDNIPRVIDETAMAVMETFEKFLET
jgi:DNA replication licensing factor MCM6